MPMSETVENGVVDVAESSGDSIAAKQQIPLDETKKQNGITNHKELSNDSLVGQDESNQESRESQSPSDGCVNGSKDNLGEAEKHLDESTEAETAKPDEGTESKMEVDSKTSMNDQSKPSDDEEKSINTEQRTEDNVPDAEKTEDMSCKSDPMDEDRVSNVVDDGSNISAANSEVVEVNTNDSKSPSIVSEDSSRDSVDTIDSKSEDSDETPVRQGLVSTVKDDDGGDILITLNEDDGEKDTDDVSKDGSNQSEKKDKEGIETESDNAESTQEEAKPANQESNQDKQQNNENVAQQPVDQIQKPQMSLITNMQQPVAAVGIAATVPTSLAITSGGQTFFIQGGASIPVGTQLVQQGPHLGYITRIGIQNIFVPVTNMTAAVPNTQVAIPQPQPQPPPQQQQQQQPPKPQPPPVASEDLKPKSSLEMIELMKWEIQNRIPDNSNWSVAFHPKREELSAITSFLLELGHDVVKESVYKDIIQIQTKKKDAGDLKDNEIESLDKMKTVYENTRKKVEHLQLVNKKCNGCEFKTESPTVMNWHKDFPHFDPPWDTSHGWLKCAHCPFRTKAAAQFSFHMSAVHSAEAKLPDKINCFQCEMCPLNTTTKNKLDKHRQKCIKHFKLNVNLHPYYHDVNFCMKTCYYKPKKPPAPKPVAKPQAPVKSVNQPSTHNMNTRREATPTTQPQKLTTPAQRPNTPSQMTPRPPPSQQMQPIPPKSQPQQQKPVSYPRPTIATARNSVPPAPRPQTPQQRPVRPQGKEMAGFEVCELCGGYVKDRHALRIHFYYAHKVEMPQAIFERPERPLSCDVCKSKFWTTQGLTKHKSTLRHYNTPSSQGAGGGGGGGGGSSTPGTNQQCFMCMRKVANLFIHIENVHGMTMKDLVAMKKCIICGITATDRKNLEMHMASAHGVLIKANDFMSQDKQSKPLTPIVSNPSKPTSAMVQTGVPVGKNTKPSIKQNLCVFCQLQFADNIQLTMHCIKNHATCNACGMVVQSNKHLTSHNCRQMKRHCDICGVRDISPDNYVEHVRKLHMKPCKVEVTKMSDDEIDEVKDKIKREYKPQVISLDSEEDSDVELVDSELGEKREKKARSIENKENIEKPADLSENSEAEEVEQNKNTFAKLEKEINESSSDSKDIKQDEESKDKSDDSETVGESAENEKRPESHSRKDGKDDGIKLDSEEDNVESDEKSNGSRKRKVSDSVENDIDDDDVNNKRIRLEGDAEKHSDRDEHEGSGDGVTVMETGNADKGEVGEMDDSNEDGQPESFDKVDTDGDNQDDGQNLV